RPDFRVQPTQTFPECPDERKGRPRDNSARDRRSRYNTESMRRCPRAAATLEVDGAAARLRSRAGKNRLGAADARDRNYQTMFRCSFPWPTGQRTEATSDFD